MSTMIVDDVELHIPHWVKDLKSFLRWRRSPVFPKRGNIWWLRGEVWADMSKEQIFWHLALKGEIFRVLANLALEMEGSMMLPDGLLYTNPTADISGNPDATFISAETRQAERIVLKEGMEYGFVEIIGTPDMVLEVVSDSSMEKDTETLFESYWLAGIPEYWIADGRVAPARFEIYRRSSKGYVPARKKDAWQRSNVFGKSFRLTEKTDRFGGPTYRLESR